MAAADQTDVEQLKDDFEAFMEEAALLRKSGLSSARALEDARRTNERIVELQGGGHADGLDTALAEAFACAVEGRGPRLRR